MSDLPRPIEQGTPKVEQPTPKPVEPPKEAQPLGVAEQRIVNRIDKDGDEDKVLRDIATGEAPHQKSPEDLSREYQANIASYGEDIKALWGNVSQQDRELDPMFHDLAEVYKGDIDKLVASKLGWYQKSLSQDNQGWGQFQVMQDLSRIREHAVMAMGEETANKILAEAQAKKAAERQKTASSNSGQESQSQTTPRQEHSKESGLSLEQVKRPYGVEDVRTMQEQFRAFEDYRKAQNAAFIINDNQFYEFLATGRLSGRTTAEKTQQPQAEKEANPQDYDTLILGFYRGWRESLIRNKDQLARTKPEVIRRLGNLEQLPNPKTLDELRDLYRKYPVLNDFSAVSYQDGIGEKGMVNTPFLHFQGHRYSGYEYDRPETQVRMYLNPPQEALPQLANEFIQLANQEQIPFYFKLIDFSLQKPSQADLTRMDRMIFYTDKDNAGRIAQALDTIKQKHPDWFQDRQLPTMTAKVADGIGVAEDPSDFQNKQFSRMGETKTSFNWVRAKFLNEVWRDTTRDVVSRNPDLRPRGGRTLREIFNDTIPAQDRGYADQIWRNGFNPDALDDKGKRVLQDALSRTMADVMPNIQPDSLLPYIDRQIRQKAGSYGINPDNLALNAA